MTASQPRQTTKQIPTVWRRLIEYYVYMCKDDQISGVRRDINFTLYFYRPKPTRKGRGRSFYAETT